MKTKEERVEFLKAVPLLSGLSEAELASLAAAMKESSCPADSLIFHEDDPGELLYFVAGGSVRIVKKSKPPLILSILEPGEFFGEMALFDRAGRSASVEAQQDAELLTLDSKSFRSLLGKHPGIGIAIIRTLAGRLRQTQQELMAARAMADYFRTRDGKKGA